MHENAGGPLAEPCDMMALMDRVAEHYGTPGMLEAILAGLRAHGKDPDRLTLADLAPVDEFHIRGRLATMELAQLAAPQAGWHVLDAGSGLGGSTRVLAAEFGCRVTGLDLTQEYCRTSAALSRRTGLDGRNRYVCGNTLATPFADGSFDLAWTQHVQMNIEDKAGFYREMARVLRPGGRFAFHDLLAGPGGGVHFPVHWAEEPSLSFLIAPGDLRAMLESSGFRVVTWRDVTDISRDWFLAVAAERQQGAPPPLGLHLLLRETAAAKFANVARNLIERRITVFQGVLEKL